MAKEVVEIYPRVFLANRTQKLHAKMVGVCEKDLVEIKVQPMERYAVKHTKRYRVDEEERYPYFPMLTERDGMYSYEYKFMDEQKYDVKIRINGKNAVCFRVYAIDEDLARLRVFKGDTHLHSNRSDGEGTPFEVACQYRAAGYDFIAITDHHLYEPSLEGKAAVEKWTDNFRVFRGEEVHNLSMGYFHIINLDGDSSVNEVIENDCAYVEKEVRRILAEEKIPDTVEDKTDYAFRVFVAREIQKRNGLAILAHPYWDVYGEYHMPVATTEELLKEGVFDAWELLAGDDRDGNGDNLQVALWNDLLAQGYTSSVLGASDSHSCTRGDSLFNHQFSLVFAKDFDDVKSAIKAGACVAVLSFNNEHFWVFGTYRYVKYSRFLLKEYFPAYKELTKKHAAAMLAEDKEAVKLAEYEIAAYNKKFF